jgi:DNA-binding MarR family transcriptional regulator
MKNELQILIDQFLNILHLYSVISRKPKDYGTGDYLYFTETHTITVVGDSGEINMTGLAEKMGVTRGAISQTIRKLVTKGLIIKSNQRNNRKEMFLSLSKKGDIVYRGQESFHNELFTFARTLYERASPSDRELVKGLFEAITSNMQQRMRALENDQMTKK